jgi:hypothetical protein
LLSFSRHELLDVENSMLAMAMEYERQELIVKEYEADLMLHGKKPKNLLAKLAQVRENESNGMGDQSDDLSEGIPQLSQIAF